MPTVSKTAQVLKYFAQQYGAQGIPRKRLVKAAYMTDILTRQYLGHPVTRFAYIKDHYGPNARELSEYAQELETAELASEVRKRDGQRTSIQLKDNGRPLVFDFSLGELEILDYVASNYLNMDLAEFIDDVVKVTDPFSEVTVEGALLPMEIVDNTGRNDVGFDLERVAIGERQVEAGQYLTLAQFANVLRAQTAPRHPS